MGKTVVTAIDDLVAFVKDHRGQALDGDKLQRLQDLDAQVHLECEKAGLSMPHVPSGDPAGKGPGFVAFGYTRLHLAGLHGHYSGHPLAPPPMLVRCADWVQAMEALRAAAAATKQRTHLRRLAVTLNLPQAVLDGQPYALSSEAASLLCELNRARNPISASAIVSKPARVTKSMPPDRPVDDCQYGRGRPRRPQLLAFP